jgi:hypothetical protein
MADASTQPADPPLARPVTSSTDVSPPSGPAISPEILRQLKLAQQRGKKIRRAAGMATFNGWTIGVFAALSLVSGIFSLTGFVLGIALAIAAFNEFNGAKLLRRLDLRAPRRLGFNQLGLCGVLIVYSLWSIHSAFAGPSPYASAMPAGGQVAPIVGSIEQLQRTIVLATYVSLIVGSIVFQGSTAWYYFSRARHIRAYVNQTPQWVIELQRADTSSGA